MGIKKYALLDTDFLYKTYLAKKNENHTLIDLILDFEDYDFFCHEMIKEELTRNKILPNPNQWFEKKLDEGRIKLYSDTEIVKSLYSIYKEGSIYMYKTLLKTSCDTFRFGFYETYYGELENEEDIDIFLKRLKECDNRIPYKNGLGEKKTLVLIQVMQIFYGNQVYVLCSDDFKARHSIASLSNPVCCLSVVGVFYKLMKIGKDKNEVKPYFDSFVTHHKNQMECKVWSVTGHQRIKVSMREVFDGIYDNMFQLLRNGDLQYREQAN